MRPACIICTGKHLAVARRYHQEFRKGYRQYAFDVVGEMEHAWMESEARWPELSAAIYAEVKQYEADPDRYDPDFTGLLTQACEIWENVRAADVAAEGEDPDVGGEDTNHHHGDRRADDGRVQHEPARGR